MTAELGADSNEFPDASVARDLNVYAVPFVKPETVHEVAGDVAVQLPTIAPDGS